MKFRKMVLPLVLAFAGLTLMVFAQKTDSEVGGVTMYPTKTIAENLSASTLHKTLAVTAKAVGLVDTLNNPGPFTVFAPTDQAFAKLPSGTVKTLLKPENKTTLAKVLNYHVISGRISSRQLARMIKSGDGKATLTTVEGGTLTAIMSDISIILIDEKGGMATITTTDLAQKNGIVHIIDAVLIPN